MADVSAESVFVYPALAISGTGPLDESPTDTISGPLTELGKPLFVAIQPASDPLPGSEPVIVRHAPATRNRRLPGWGGLPSSRRHLDTFRAPTPGSPSRLRVQDLHRFGC